ncbi:Rieske 2Fe-2S domain-containing protein [Pseudomonas syringae]|uniref:Rieske 2Fe-2S domain-containing protein n=1 Tax=Pseudomonas syringae TaxID=317 RepID=UPI00290DFE80|nr:Rieske 2Fe-2S domain-containing protein [Pseudomonas syringae pv. actinidifoliorum]MDU8522463.1 Rieske 2Fe-2S domain-containing protein [Pseudomonas syringae pv. actinidifoliorum]MDU8529133.1 Rieske 2Fe-2S domain-containing protein [Pseudomonas syringae pv. actinidifoliorum]
MNVDTLGRMSRALVDAYWHPLCLSSQLSNDKDYLRFDVCDFEVVIFNDAGSLIAFDNRCPHRGAKIFTEGGGNQKLLCQYHGWSFSGSKLRVPGSVSFVGCNVDNANLNFFKVAKCGGVVFFAINPEVSLEDQLGKELFALLEKFSSSLSRSIDFNRYSFESDWPVALENALEPYHIPMVHRDTLAPLKLGAGRNEFFGQNSIWYAPLENESMNRRLSMLGKFFQQHDAYPGYMSIYIYPFAMISSTYGYSYSMQNFFPANVIGQTHFTSQLFPVQSASPRHDGIVDALMSSTREMNRKVFLEDQAVCKRVPLDTWSWTPPRYYSSLEVKLLHFRASCSKWADRLGLDKRISVRMHDE